MADLKLARHHHVNLCLLLTLAETYLQFHKAED